MDQRKGRKREDRDFSESDRERKHKRRFTSFFPDCSPSKEMKQASCPIDGSFYAREKKMGPKVSKEVADLINKGLGRPIQDDKKKQKCLQEILSSGKCAQSEGPYA